MMNVTTISANSRGWKEIFNLVEIGILINGYLLRGRQEVAESMKLFEEWYKVVAARMG